MNMALALKNYSNYNIIIPTEKGYDHLWRCGLMLDVNNYRRVHKQLIFLNKLWRHANANI